MADIVNPYANPYLPAFVSQRPRMADPMPQTQTNLFQPQTFSQIHSVNGFDGARNYALANGASEILAEADPNIARIYIVAKDVNGQRFMEAYRLIKEEEPKPVTMDDLNSKMNELLERINKLEGEKVTMDGQPVRTASWKSAKQPNAAGNQPNGRNGQNGAEPTGGTAANEPK